MTDTIEVAGELVEESTVGASSGADGGSTEPKPRRRFTLQDAVDWLETPENQAKLEQWKKDFDSEFRRGLEHLDDMVSGTANIIREALEDEQTAQELGDAFLDSLLGRR